MPRTTKKKASRKKASKEETSTGVLGDPTPVQLAIKNLCVDAPYQDARRRSAIVWVKKTWKKFDVTKLGVIDVSRRAGKYWVVDGMARVLLLREVGATHIWAKVHEGLSYKQEAQLFVELNTERRRPTAFQKFSGAYEAGEPSVVAVVELAQKYGYDVLSEAPGDNVIRSHYQLRKIAAAPRGLIALEQTLNLTRTCWPGFPDALQSYLLRGLTYFFEQHGDTPGVAERLMQKLPSVHPANIQAMAHLKQQGHSGNGGYKAVYLVLLEMHNKGTLAKHRLRPCLRTPLVRKTGDSQATKPSVPLSCLADVFKPGVRGPGFLFRKGGAKTLAKRLQNVLEEDQTVETFAGAKAASMFRAYLREQREKFSPQMAEACERWGVAYQDLLLRKPRSNGNGTNGRSSKKAAGEVIFDATSSRSVLEQLDASA